MANWRRRLARWILEKLLRGDQGGDAKLNPLESRPIYEHPSGELLLTSQRGSGQLPVMVVEGRKGPTLVADLTPAQQQRWNDGQPLYVGAVNPTNDDAIVCVARITDGHSVTARLTPEQAARLAKNLHAWASTGGIA